MHMKGQETYRTPHRLYKERKKERKKDPLPYNNQNTKHTESRKNFKSFKGKRPSNI